jgi:hypothetical protein
MSKTTDYIIDLHNKDVEIKELKEDRETVYNTACKLAEYLDENDYKIEPEKIDELIATIQNYSK